MELGQPGFAVQDLGGHAQPLEVVQHIGLDALQPGLGCPDAVCFNAECQVLGLDKAVVAPRQLILEHLLYSVRMLSKSSPWRGMEMVLAKALLDAARFKKDSWKRMELSK